MTDDEPGTDDGRGPGPGPMRLDELRSALDNLAEWPGTALWPDVQTLAGRVALLVWEELKARRLWDQLPSAERAAMHWTLTTGHTVRTGWAPDVTDWRPVIAGLRRECAFFAFYCEPRRAERWPEADGRLREGEQAAQGLAWYLSFRPAWRAEVFRVLEAAAHRSGGDPDSPDGPDGPEGERPSLWEVLGAVQQRSGRGGEPGDAPPGERAESVDTAARFAALPEGWQVETLRRIAQGQGPRQAVTGAVRAIAALPHFGVPLHPAPPP
ncbi:hypothetical protein JNUCC64_23550 [Streptomyces sp. JNUCC 64]